MQNFMKTIISAIQTWTKKKIKNSTADWSENDSSADSYVKNRTHYEENITKVLLEEQTVDTFTLRDSGFYSTSIPPLDLKIDITYIVTWDGVPYEVKAFDASGNVSIGNTNLLNGGVPFFACIAYGSLIFTCNSTSTSHTIKIAQVQNIVHQLDSKFVPSDVFVVNVTGNQDDGYTADKTFTEMSTAFENNKFVLVCENKTTYYMPKAFFHDEVAVFFDFHDSNNYNYIQIDISGSIRVSHREGRELPFYFSGDEGKILRIVNGVPTWVSLANAEEATF